MYGSGVGILSGLVIAETPNAPSVAVAGGREAPARILPRGAATDLILARFITYIEKHGTPPSASESPVVCEQKCLVELVKMEFFGGLDDSES